MVLVTFDLERDKTGSFDYAVINSLGRKYVANLMQFPRLADGSVLTYLTNPSCWAESVPNRRLSLWRSKLASPCILTAERLGSHFG